MIKKFFENFNEIILMTLLILYGFFLGMLFFDSTITFYNGDLITMDSDSTDFYIEKDQYVGITKEIINHSMVGYVEPQNPNYMYIQQDKSPEMLYRICVHERMHQKGIPSSHHDYMHKIEETIVDPFCIRLLYHIKPES